MLEERSRAASDGCAGRGRSSPRCASRPDANLATISVPGRLRGARGADRVAPRPARVPLQRQRVARDEIELKRLAAAQRLLCMGPDCGTAYLERRRPRLRQRRAARPRRLRGRLGHRAAGGGLAAGRAGRRASRTASASGGRDLSVEVGGAMTRLALEALGGRSRHRSDRRRSPSRRRPACCLARDGDARRRRARDRGVLPRAPRAPGAAGTWVRRSRTPRRRPWRSCAACHGHREPSAIPRPCAPALRHSGPARRAPRPLHRRHGRPRGAADPGAAVLGGRARRDLDLGADEFTVGRPHPMLDPDARDARVREAGALGRRRRHAARSRARARRASGSGAPRGRVRSAMRAQARSAAGARCSPVASVVGTEADPQGLGRSGGSSSGGRRRVLPSKPQAARFPRSPCGPSWRRRCWGAR